MFKNEYQGGAVVDIFSAQGNDPVAKWKLHGAQTAISKEFDKEVKGFVYILEGSSQKNRMQMPKDSRMALGLSQRFLVLQVFVPQGKDFSTELMVTDSGNLKRRLYLSTVHKELSATPLHAKIPLSSLRLNIWCNMCIDLVSFTGEIFKGASFLSLDRIIVCASCRLRRIFTMKLQPADAYSESDLYICGNGPREIIPRTCQFPADVQHITQVVNMNKLRLAEMRLGGSLSSELEQTNSGSSITTRVAKNQDVCHIAFGSKVPGPPPPSGRKPSASGSREVVLVSGSKAGRTCGPVRQNSSDGVEKQTHLRSETAPPAGHDSTQQACQDSGQPIGGLTGSHWSLQPHPPPGRASLTDRPGVRKLRVHNAERETPAVTGSAQKCSEKEASPTTNGDCPPCRVVSSTAVQTPGPMGDNAADKGALAGCLKDKVDLDCSKQTQEPAKKQLTHEALPRAASTEDQARGVEPQLHLGDVFTFLSRPHSARRGQGHPVFTECSTSPSDIWYGGDGPYRGARLEDDFIGSESEEEDSYSRPLMQRSGARSGPSLRNRLGRPEAGDHEPTVLYGPGSVMAKMTASLGGGLPCSRWPEAERPGMVPTRCLSPDRARLGSDLDSPRREKAYPDTLLRTSLSRKSLKEIHIGDPRLLVEHTESSGASHQPVKGSSSESGAQVSLGNQEEEEELLMLASLLRQEEEEREEMYGEGRSAGLSASQIHNCNVSISTSSDDTSTWTPYVPMPAYQGHHYQEEMSPLLHSNPRERLSVLSPPIIPASQQERAEETGHHHRSTVTGTELSMSEGQEEDEFLNLLYDPCLNCYFDPESGKYYELV